MGKLGGETIRVTVCVNSEAEPELYETLAGTHSMRRSKLARMLMGQGISSTEVPADARQKTVETDLIKTKPAAVESASVALTPMIVDRFLSMIPRDKI